MRYRVAGNPAAKRMPVTVRGIDDNTNTNTGAPGASTKASNTVPAVPDRRSLPARASAVLPGPLVATPAHQPM